MAGIHLSNFCGSHMVEANRPVLFRSTPVPAGKLVKDCTGLSLCPTTIMVMYTHPRRR